MSRMSGSTEDRWFPNSTTEEMCVLLHMREKASSEGDSTMEDSSMGWR